MFLLYKKGKTMQEIGEKYSISRERVRQLIERYLAHRAAEKKGVDMTSRELVENFKSHTHRVINKFRDNRSGDEVSTILDQAKEKGISPENFFAASEFLKLTGLSKAQLEKFRPDILETIINNKRKRWSRHYAQCRQCGTTTIRHRAYGLCNDCYYKSAHWEEIRDESLRKGAETRYAGNREAAIQANNEQCVRCGLSRDECRSKYGRDLAVVRKNGNKKDNSLNNLIPLCKLCVGLWRYPASRKVHFRSLL